ncbi:type VI secretion system Vgr family protein, partial [Morganella morganii]
VAMGWNGSGYGFSAVPRIGQEVIVSYLNGDIDRPIITGCTYNGRNSPPSAFPGSKTQTAFRTKTHKGDGFNELRFEDENGKQQVFIHAQRDMDTVVLNDRSTLVKANHSERIEKDQSMTVLGQRTAVIGEDNKETVGQDKTVAVGNTLSLTAGEAIELRCGSSVLRMDSAGRMTINGTAFSFEASGPVQITGKDVDIN